MSGRDRTQALERSRRALREFVVEGMPTVLPFHRAVVRDAAFTSEPFTVHTRWIESDFDNQLAAFIGAVAAPADAGERERVVVEVDGRRLEVVLPAGLGASASTGRPAAPRRSVGKSAAAAASGDALTAPMQGTIISIAVENGQVVAAGDLIVVLEAMKMEQPITAHKAGTVTGLTAEVGQTVVSGATLLELKD